jgi:hypothetical protein
MKVSETLYAARDYIREHGWRRLGYGIHGGRRCMAGACSSVVADGSQFVSACWSRFIGPGTPIQRALAVVTDGVDIGDFNDFHCETADDAIAALEIAADIAAAEGN